MKVDMNFNPGLIILVIAAVDRHTGYEGYTSGSRDQNLMSRIITTQFCLVHTRRRIGNAVNINHFADIASHADGGGVLFVTCRF